MGGNKLHLCLCLSKLLSSSNELGETILRLTWDLWKMTKLLFETLSIHRASLCRLFAVPKANIRDPSSLVQPVGDQ